MMRKKIVDMTVQQQSVVSLYAYFIGNWMFF